LTLQKRARRVRRTRASPPASAADLDGDATRRANAITTGRPGNFFVVNPDVDDVNVTDSGAYSDYHALQVELRRRLSRGLMINGSYQYAVEGTSAFQGCHYGRVMIPSDNNVRHAFKVQWDWTVPVGHRRRYGSNLHPILNGIVGGWEFSGAGRVQARMMDFGNVRLVGMTKEDVQKMYNFDIRTNPANGLQTPYMMPDDVILNTRRAFNTSPTSPTGYSDLGVPEGRYFAPANSENCIELQGRHEHRPRGRRGHLPGHDRLPGSREQLRSGWPSGTDLVQGELVAPPPVWPLSSSQATASHGGALVPVPRDPNLHA
jgi:hypothetical protein